MTEDTLRDALDTPALNAVMQSLVDLVDAPTADDNVKVRFVRNAAGITLTVRTEGPEASAELVIRAKP